jgi:hypothetical protein
MAIDDGGGRAGLRFATLLAAALGWRDQRTNDTICEIEMAAMM